MQLADWKNRIKQRVKSLVQITRTQISKTNVRKWNTEQIKRIGVRAFNFVSEHKKQSAMVAGAVVLATTATVSADYYYESNIIPVYHVVVNGKEIGVVSSPEVVHKWADAKLEAEKAKHGMTLKITDYITFQEERLYKGQYDDAAALAALSDVADIKVEAVKIVVDGKLVGYAPDQQTAETVMNSLKEKYAGTSATAANKKMAVAAASDEKPAGQATPIVRFKEDVQLEKGEVPAAQVLTGDQLKELLSKGTYKQVTHTVKEGDTISGIAQQYGITQKEIYANNPGITEFTLLQLDQKLNVTANRPYVTVQVTEQAEQEEEIPYQLETRTNDKVAKGESKVIQNGQPGKKLVQYEIIKENGQVVQRKTLKQEIITPPVTQIVEKGTKVIPSRGTGRYSWPARGYISSGFGTRWGRMHKGIDIAGSGTIKAADNGRVVAAGWDGDYGNAVTIDHGNGMQTVYGHMRSIKVKVGDVVAQGQGIGVMGSTGDSTGVHLHFEVRVNGRPQNPLRYLSR